MSRVRLKSSRVLHDLPTLGTDGLSPVPRSLADNRGKAPQEDVLDVVHGEAEDIFGPFFLWTKNIE